MSVQLNSREQGVLQSLGINVFALPSKDGKGFSLAINMNGWSKEHKRFEKVTNFIADVTTEKELGEALSQVTMALEAQAKKGVRVLGRPAAQAKQDDPTK